MCLLHITEQGDESQQQQEGEEQGEESAAQEAEPTAADGEEQTQGMSLHQSSFYLCYCSCCFCLGDLVFTLVLCGGCVHLYRLGNKAY